ncbi:hypothetical protein P3S68_016271 [Capsicum galapagoense]
MKGVRMNPLEYMYIRHCFYLHAFLNFDGSSNGNPGPAGAGAVLLAADGSMVYRLREGLGVATNNFAEYRGLILGPKFKLKKGFKHIQVQGDSKLVCMQVMYSLSFKAISQEDYF